ncbi:MAG: DUF1772 domain-containing protein [Rhodobacteraceae bacterium]|nr:DUF1772 domain-containing protein [Paracoccaceae bacterium]PHR62302.1 MAG: hypothetical protein COA47_04840 [Robiginitomaculum sp.]
MQSIKLTVLIAALLGAGALFGFYFTMSVSIMPGLDLTEPYAAITANQDIGRANKQSLFFVALMGTPVAIIAGVALYWRAKSTRNWLLLGLLGWVGMLVVTLMLNVPLNQILDGLNITAGQDGLADIWAAYAVDWQKWNWLRVLTSGLSLVFVACAFRRAD